MSWSGVDPVEWASRNTKLMEAVLRNSVQELANEAGRTIPNGGRVPVKTGNLARSVVVSTVPPTVKEEGASNGNIESGIASIEIGKPVFLGWQANYARRMNYGFVGTDSLGRYYGSAQAVITTGYSNRAGYGFAEATAAKWSTIVDEQVAKLRKR